MIKKFHNIPADTEVEVSAKILGVVYAVRGDVHLIQLMTNAVRNSVILKATFPKVSEKTLAKKMKTTGVLDGRDIIDFPIKKKIKKN